MEEKEEDRTNQDGKSIDNQKSNVQSAEKTKSKLGAFEDGKSALS